MKEANDLFNNKKYKILFVCLGNICRSPSAEAVNTKSYLFVSEIFAAHRRQRQ